MISIVIPAYNSERFLAQTIESVLAQSYVEWELVIVDDGSTDGTPEIMRRYAAQDSRIRAVTQPNGGVAAARSRGYAESNSTSEFIIFLDNDDMWESDALQMLLETLQKDSRATAVAGLCRTIDADDNFLQEKAPSTWQMVRIGAQGIETCAPGDGITFDVIVCQNPILSPGMVLIRREFLQQIGPWDQAVAPADDWDIWARLTLRGPILTLPCVVLRYRMHGNNASRQSERMKRAERAFYHKLMAQPELSAAQKQKVRQGAWNHEYGLFKGRRRWAGEALTRRQFGNAAKQARHALIHYVRALRLRVGFAV